jgi:4-hydroxybenzoate polyprenyltransferase
MDAHSGKSLSYPSDRISEKILQMKYLILAMRPHQWVKNIVIFAPIIFSQNIFHWEMLGRIIAAFLLFCSYSGCVYIINDMLDMETDKKHPLKRLRPIASGKLARSTAILGIAAILGGALPLGWFISRSFFMIASLYLIVQLAYSYILKKVVILDAFSIAAGFVLRVIAGAEVIRVPISSWLLICTMLLSLFLALSKRRHELILLEGDAVNHRSILKEYNPYLLDQMIAVVTSATVIAYALYTVAPETVQKFHTSRLIYSVPFVLYGIFRYLYLIHRRNMGGSPEKVLIADKPLLLNVIIYGLVIIMILYI